MPHRIFKLPERVLDSPTAGFAQLGSVWLPLQHVLMLPFVWYSPLFYSGIAGSIISMASYVVACVYLYKIVYGLTNGIRVAAVAGVLVFALNPNILYMQSIPMAELLFFATTAATLYYLQCWIQTERKYYLFVAAFACASGALTRYESWLMPMLGFTFIVLLVAWKRYDRAKTEGSVLCFMFIAWAPVFGWIGWNWLIMGDPMYFPVAVSTQRRLCGLTRTTHQSVTYPRQQKPTGTRSCATLAFPSLLPRSSASSPLWPRKRRLHSLPALESGGVADVLHVGRLHRDSTHERHRDQRLSV